MCRHNLLIHLISIAKEKGKNRVKSLVVSHDIFLDTSKVKMHFSNLIFRFLIIKKYALFTHNNLKQKRREKLILGFHFHIINK